MKRLLILLAVLVATAFFSAPAMAGGGCYGGGYGYRSYYRPAYSYRVYRPYGYHHHVYRPYYRPYSGVHFHYRY